MLQKRARLRLAIGLTGCFLVALVAAVINARPSDSRIVGVATEAVVQGPSYTNVFSGIDGINVQNRLADLTARSLLVSEVASTPPAVEDIARAAGIPASDIWVSTSYAYNMPESIIGPDMEVRANQIVDMRRDYQVNIQPDPTTARFSIYARAPTVASAVDLANAVAPGLNRYLRQVAASNGVSASDQMVVRQTNSARGAALNSKAPAEIALFTFLIVFVLCGLLLIAGIRFRAGWNRAAQAHAARALGHSTRRRAAPAKDKAAAAAARNAGTAPNAGTARNAGAGRGRTRRAPTIAEACPGDDVWPRTKRTMPWLAAIFMAVLWLMPFDSMQLGSSGSSTIDLKFDRIVLPIILVLWAIALACGGRARPRLRGTGVHVAVFGWVGLAALTFVLNAHYLNHTLELSRAIKQLFTLGAYAACFVFFASAIRRAEVPAFMTFTLGLAVLTAIGTVLEYRTGYNVFFSVAHALFPEFKLSAAPEGIDNLGRKLVAGPGEHPLEAVAMFTIALPVALVGLTDARTWGRRLLYALAAALLLMAAISTERKSGLLGPLAAGVVMLCLRPKQMLRLVPLLLVLLLLVRVAAPGAIGSVTNQLNPSNLGVSTVSERVVRYDAIRPDVWLHLAVGQGFGTYSVRILDNQYLDTLVEGGVLGIIAYLAMLGGVVVIGMRIARRGGPETQSVAIAAAGAAAGAILLSATFDFLAFPHGPYLLMVSFGMLAAATGGRGGDSGDQDQPTQARRARAPAASAASSQALEPTWSS
jgi:hypothetical protein